MEKRDFLTKIGLLGAFALAGDARAARAATDHDGACPLVGLWEMTVVGDAGTYHYMYSISRDTWVGTGDIDEGFQQFKYSPTVGAYARKADGSYRYSERGWVFDRQGNNVGTFRSVGTFKLDSTGKRFGGPGTFTQLDARGKTVFTEPFKATATKIDV